MAATYVARGNWTSGGFAQTIAVPAGIQEDDLLLVSWTGRYDDDHSVGGAGWTKITETTTGGTVFTDDVKVSLWYKVAGASESSVLWVDGGNTNLHVMFAFRGIDTTDPIDNFAISDTGGSTTTSHTAPSVTPVVADCALVALSGFGNIGFPYTAQSRTVIGSNSTTSGEDSGQDLQYSILSGSGASGTTTMTAGVAVSGGYISVTLKPEGANAPVTYDNSSESHTGITGSVSEAQFEWQHSPVDTPRGLVVYVVGSLDATDIITSVTYGGVPMNAVTGGLAQDTSGEAGFSKVYFLGTGIPTGEQTVQVNRDITATPVWACCTTVTAISDTNYTGVLTEEENQLVTEENIDDSSLGNANGSLRFCGGFFGASGISNPGDIGASSTYLQGIDYGAYNSVVVRETVSGVGSRPVGFINKNDDTALVYLAVYAPGTTSSTVSVDAASLALTGYAPSTSVSLDTINVPAGSVELAGLAPTIERIDNHTAIPNAGELSIVGTLPRLNPTDAETPVGVGSLTLTGLTPTVGQYTLTVAFPIFLGPTLNLIGYSPVIRTTERRTVEVPAGDLTLSSERGRALILGNPVVAPSTGSIAFEGLQPVALKSGDFGISAMAGALILQGYAPSLALTELIELPAGVPDELVLTGYAPKANTVTRKVVKINGVEIL